MYLGPDLGSEVVVLPLNSFPLKFLSQYAQYSELHSVLNRACT